MSYYFKKEIESTFVEAIDRTTQSLQSEGFGVLTEIRIHEKLKEKIGVDFQRYVILGACHPESAYIALQHENKIGTMLPCNVIVQELEGNKCEVAAINPIESMQAVKNEKLAVIANEVKMKLERVIEKL